MRATRFAILVAAFLLSRIPARAESGVPMWTRFEAQFTSAANYENPVQDVQVEVEFTSPGGKKQTVDAFWDGGKIWKVRFSPDETGKWTYRSRSIPDSDSGLHNQSGEFTCIPYAGDNPLYRHGAIRVAENRRYLIHADGTPYFWLADTAWNGVLKADPGSWAAYIGDRKSKGFTAVQFIATPWAGAAGNADLRLAYQDREKIRLDPAFFQWMDERVDALNEAGLVAAPGLIWAEAGKWRRELNPGASLPDDQIIVLARHLVARWGAHQVIWMLGGDGDYRGERAERWKKIGRAVFGDNPSRLATMHPGGQQWIGAEFRGEPWFSFIGYQSGHGDSEADFRWLCEGPPSQDWKTEPLLPIINLEPNYEGHVGYTHRKALDAYAVRRAAYWSLLVSPPAGVTYGGHGIWSWELRPQEPMNHPGAGIAAPWHEAVKMPGSVGMKHLKALFSSVEWWKLVPDQELLAEQPGRASPEKFIAAAKSESGDLAVIYVPVGGKVSLQSDRLKLPAKAEWFDPASGARSSAGEVQKGGVQTFDARTTADRVLVIKAATP